MYLQTDQEMDIEARIARAQQLRATVTNPAALADRARRLIAATPNGCEHLVAYSPEGHAIAAAASALAVGHGQRLSVHLASHLAPLAAGPAAGALWEWMSAEEALGLGPVRPWVVRWAQTRGGATPTSPRRRPALAQVA